MQVLWQSLKRLWHRTTVQHPVATSEADTDSITEAHEFDLFCRKTISDVLKHMEVGLVSISESRQISLSLCSNCDIHRCRNHALPLTVQTGRAEVAGKLNAERRIALAK